MKEFTYYEILGVKQDASFEEITLAKNNLAKIYHPDANIHSGIDTTLRMQEILEAYELLSDSSKREVYDNRLNSTRVFRMYEMDKDVESDEYSFVLFWQAAHNLHHSLLKSRSIRKKNRPFLVRQIPFLRKIIKEKNSFPSHVSEELHQLKEDIIHSVDILSDGNIPTFFWTLEAMNWVLIQWGQERPDDYLDLFDRYEQFVNQTYTKDMKLKLRYENRRFHNQLSKAVNASY